MTLRECMQLAKDAGFDGIELNYDLDNDLSPKSGTKEYAAIRKMADEIGIQVSGLCSGTEGVRGRFHPLWHLTLRHSR